MAAVASFCGAFFGDGFRLARSRGSSGRRIHAASGHQRTSSGDELQRQRIHAVAQARRGGAVGEDMAEVPVA